MMKRRMHMSSMQSVALYAIVIVCAVACAPCEAADVVLATSGFNDQAGINSNGTANSPFQIGVTVHGQGVGEPGWDSPWVRLGGFDDRAPVSSEFVYEGDASTKLFADNTFGTAFERPWFNIVPTVRIDAHILVRPAAAMRGNATFTTAGGEIEQRTAAYWDIISNGKIRVFNKATNQTIDTGFSTLPNTWNKYSLILDTPSQTWKFLFNDVEFRTPQPLTFLNTTNFVDRVNMQAAGTLNSYVDAVKISSVFFPISVYGDFNGDLVVDAADYTLWRNQLGNQIPVCTGADANCNGFVDNFDYQAWKSTFGNTVGSGAALSAVPEPSTLLLNIAALATLATRRRKPNTQEFGDGSTVRCRVR